ncbi:MAG: 4Fe-4S binding protein [Spirochaetales bacterium]|nr:4Fe-4S binding protein [Spirochaetales bacterium]
MNAYKAEKNTNAEKSNTKKRLTGRQKTGYISLGAVFVLMCMLQLWYTILIVFSFGLILTIRDRRRSFCTSYCPMATVQDDFYTKTTSSRAASGVTGEANGADKSNISEKNRKRNRVYQFLKKQWFKLFAALIFWGWLIGAIALFYDEPAKLWQAMLGLMLGSTFIAIILQSISRKRVWCSTICPYGNLLQKTIQVSGGGRKSTRSSK